MFRYLYKQSLRNRSDLQEERRKTLLEEQKQKRLLLQDLQREVDFSGNRYGDKEYTAKVLKDAYGSYYDLQLSEWLRERPENICEWVMVPCPKGQRCYLVANGGYTYMYSKSKRRRMTFHTRLPGDNCYGYGMRTILDCVYVNDDTFYVLDALIYGNQELVHCEAQFRFFWLRSKFDECEGLSERSGDNEKPLKLLQWYDFENEANVSEALQRYPIWAENEPKLDGLLFYHKEASYTCGSTPLVGWLFPFMVPDILGINVNASYQCPSNYTEPIAYMDEFDAKLANQKQKYIRQTSKSIEMDTLETLNNDESEKTNTEDAGNVSIGDIFETERKLEIYGTDDRCLVNDMELVN